MSSARRGKPSLSVSLPSNNPGDLPPIAALFLIDFDVKAGYTILWQRAEDGLKLDGLVEYKSLPSGLHTVTDDLIYFVHDDDHAGVSAFVNEPCDEEDARHARMIAVGILVPLSYGRLGRAWRHAEGLKSIASKMAKDRKDTDLLEKYWLDNKATSSATEVVREPAVAETPIAAPSVTFSNATPETPKKRHTRNRSASDGGALQAPEQKLSPYHPAWSLTTLLEKFGPLIFPVHRAAMLRKRILISCHAPVRQICDFVYDISILSNIPLSVNDALPHSAATHRLRPLFNIGVHDIPFLTEDFEASKRRQDGSAVTDDEAGTGWIACTTDSILAMKDTLWDMLIIIPPDYASNAQEKAWPVVECPRGQPVKATQRDLRRFNALNTGLARLAAASGESDNLPESPRSEAPDERRISTSHSARTTWERQSEAAENLVEPLSWAALAYNGFMWWASAGEQLRSEEQEETTRDAALLADLGPASHKPMSMPQLATHADPLVDSVTSLAAQRNSEHNEAQVELAIIAYFHRLTAQMLTVLSDIVDSADEVYVDDDVDDEEVEDRGPASDSPAEDDDALLQPPLADSLEQPAVTVDSHSVENMGLDVWSAGDALFVHALMNTYFDRRARVEGKGVEVCGVRVC